MEDGYVKCFLMKSMCHIMCSFLDMTAVLAALQCLFSFSYRLFNLSGCQLLHEPGEHSRLKCSFLHFESSSCEITSMPVPETNVFISLIFPKLLLANTTCIFFAFYLSVGNSFNVIDIFSDRNFLITCCS